MNIRVVLSYTALFILSVVVFLILLFPQERIAARLSTELSAPDGNFQADIERVKLSFPNSIKFENTKLTLNKRSQIQPDEITIRVTPGLIFRKNKKIRYFSKLYNGEMKGFVNVESETSRIKNVEVEGKGISIERYRYNTRMADITLKCIIGGNYTFSKDNQERGSGQGNLKISGFNADLRRSLLNRLKLPKVDFSTIDIDFAQSGNVFDIKELKARGSVINVNLKGRITVGKDSSDTQLSLTGNILPDSPYLTRLSNSAIVRSLAKDAQRSGIRFSIKGTLDQPRFTL